MSSPIGEKKRIVKAPLTPAIRAPPPIEPTSPSGSSAPPPRQAGCVAVQYYPLSQVLISKFSKKADNCFTSPGKYIPWAFTSSKP
jgi:hypothetical protein